MSEQPSGGVIPGYTPRPGERLVQLSPGYHAPTGRNPHGDEYWRAQFQAKEWGDEFLRGQLALAEEMQRAREHDLAAAQGRVNGLRDALAERPSPAPQRPTPTED